MNLARACDPKLKCKLGTGMCPKVAMHYPSSRQNISTSKLCARTLGVHSQPISACPGRFTSLPPLRSRRQLRGAKIQRHLRRKITDTCQSQRRLGRSPPVWTQLVPANCLITNDFEEPWSYLAETCHFHTKIHASTVVSIGTHFTS